MIFKKIYISNFTMSMHEILWRSTFCNPSLLHHQKRIVIHDGVQSMRYCEHRALPENIIPLFEFIIKYKFCKTRASQEWSK